MKPAKSILFLSFFLVQASWETSTSAERSPTEILMDATTLACTFTAEQQTRWSSSGPTKEEGDIQDKVTFVSINHKSGQAKILGGTRHDDEERIPIKLRVFTHSITFFELTRVGELNPVITTVLDDYYAGTAKFIAVRSAHVTSAFKRAIASQQTGTCVPG